MGAAVAQRDDTPVGEVDDEETMKGVGREVGRCADREIVRSTLPPPIAAGQARGANLGVGAVRLPR